MDDAIQDRVADFIDSMGMLPPGARVVVAVSGGQDSCALLHILHALSPSRGWLLHAAHLHHGLRGVDADGDASMVVALSALLHIPCTVDRADVRGIALRRHVSLEHAGREARRAFLELVAVDVGATHIALGHTLDDRVETVLLNIMRGTGVHGLAAMPAVAGPRVRPLLEVRRFETEAYCLRHAIAFRTDAHNLSLSHTRNRVRTELLPQMAAYYNPAAIDALARLARTASDDVEALNLAADEAFRRAVVALKPGGVTLDASALASAPAAVRRRALRRGLSEAAGNLDSVEYVHTIEMDRLLTAAAEGGRGAAALPGGMVLRAAAGRLTFIAGAASEGRNLRYPLQVPGAVEVSELGLVVRCEWTSRPDAWPALGGDVAWVDASAVAGTLVVRTRVPGDRFRPFGAPGTRKLQDYLVDRKVPAADRRNVLLVEDASGILWVVGHTTAERARSSGGPGPMLRLSVEATHREA